MNRPAAGAIVVVDWRPGQHPEPGGLRPGVVVEDSRLFARYPMMLVVPLTRDERLAVADLTVRLEPSAENGVIGECWALPHHVSAIAVRRIQTTPGAVTAEQLAAIRQRIALAIGLG